MLTNSRIRGKNIICENKDFTKQFMKGNSVKRDVQPSKYLEKCQLK